LFECYLDNGVNWTRRPITALCWKKCDPVPLEETMYWDCFSPYVDVGIRSRLKGLRGILITPSNKREWGEYMFTIDWGWENKGILDTNFSEHPEPLKENPGYQIDQNFYSVENKRIKYTDNSFMTEFTDLHYTDNKEK
jgi:hypothetical protein